ncbi:hypothetical protein MRX96_005592 [Rhipicephalus microplus]
METRGASPYRECTVAGFGRIIARACPARPPAARVSRSSHPPQPPRVLRRRRHHSERCTCQRSLPGHTFPPLQQRWLPGFTPERESVRARFGGPVRDRALNVPAGHKPSPASRFS